MPAPEIRAVGPASTGTGTLLPGMPEGVEIGDLAIMFIESGGATAETPAETKPTISGSVWTEVGSIQSGNTRATVYAQILASITPGRTVSDTGDHQNARIIAIKKGTFDEANWKNVVTTGTQTSTKAVSIGTATTTVAEALVFAYSTGNLPDANTTTEFSAAANAALESVTEQLDYTSASGDGGAMLIITGIKKAAGATGTTTATAVTAAERAWITLAVVAPVPEAPTVTTVAASSVARVSATLNGNVNPHALATTYWFEYGTTEALGTKTEEVSGGEGASPVARSKGLTGLTQNTKYYFRVAAKNANGEVKGTILNFTTFDGVDPSRVPPANFRPYAASSPFNTLLGTRPKPAPGSAAMVTKLLPQFESHSTISTEGAAEDYNHAVYLALAEDPKHPFEFTEAYEVDKTLGGAEAHVPQGARAAGGEDGHIAVIDEVSGTEYDVWQLTSKVGGAGVKLKGSWGAALPASGSGVGNKPGATAAGFGVAAGLIRGEDFLAGEINHALFLISSYVEGFIAPATHTGRNPVSPEGWPAMGQRLRLVLTEAEVNALAVPEWQKIILRCLRKYGAYVGDTGGGLFKTISPEVYVAAQMTNPFLTYAEAHSGDAGITVFGGNAFYNMNSTMESLALGGALQFVMGSEEEPAPTPEGGVVRRGPYPLVPKLALPLSFGGTTLNVIEQGTEDEVAQCVYVILATPLGSRIDDTQFGVEDPTFDQLPLDLSEMLAAIHTYEPAAEVETAQEIKELADRITLGVST